MKKFTELRSNSYLVRQNLRLVKHRKPPLLGKTPVERLRALTIEFGFSIALGDLLYLEDGWYVTHGGLLRLARRRNCNGIRVQQIRHCCEPASRQWVFKAFVFDRPKSKGFVGYGDADPSNVSALVRGSEMRVAETRAVNRALRKAYGIGLCSVDELGWAPRRLEPDPPKPNGPILAGDGKNGHSNGQPRLRDRLCLLIRQYRLDTALVKAYAADYCGTPTLHLASRESVEAFINHLAERAANDREALLCRLNSYAKAPEAHL